MRALEDKSIIFVNRYFVNLSSDLGTLFERGTVLAISQDTMLGR